MDGTEKAARMKYWGELTTDEKVERMRDVVKNIQRDMRRIDHMMREFYRHQHATNGTVLVETKSDSWNEDTRRDNKTDVHF